MVAHDISRHLFRPASHYSGLRMQQGRVSLDSDFNEARILDDEGLRLLVRDVVGPHGTPDSGFLVENVTTAPYDFQIHAGTFYLGGLRHEIHAEDDPLGPQAFREQSNWLQSSRPGIDPPLPTVPSLIQGPRNDLVYLIGWEQGVTSVEDHEFREQAIAAQDTGYRVRRMHRVYVHKDTPTDCSGAFADLLAGLTSGSPSFDIANNELRSNARLTVRYDPGKAGKADLCTPPALQGFNSAANETIRVQLIGAQQFLWSIDNAAPLYRVSVALNDIENRITFRADTLPRDAAHHPRVTQVLELLPWSARLPNGEHVADHPIAPNVGGGVYGRVLTPYDPETHSFTVQFDNADLPTVTAMLAWLALEEADEEKRHMFVRLWQPGDIAGDQLDPDPSNDALDTTFGIPFELDVEVPLGDTGYFVKFSADGIVGDHWILSTRPATTHKIVPWDLATGVAPHGPRRYYTPLAVIRWYFDSADALQHDIHDCRRTFRPLTKIRGCCTVTVGDGVTSFGDFTSINDAIASIPILEAGKICVLPGNFAEQVIITSRQNLVIEGCGARTVIHTPADNPTSQGLVKIRLCTNITLRSLQLDAEGQIGVMATSTQGLILDRVDVTTRRDGNLPEPDPTALWIPTTSSPMPLSTVAFGNGSFLTMTCCSLTMVGELSSAANVTLAFAGDIRINGCRIDTPALGRSQSRAWGGVCLTNVSNFEISNNTITGGLGHGITFGASLSFATIGDLTIFDPSPRFIIDTTNDCPSTGGELPLDGLPPGGGDEPLALLPGANTRGVIRGNRISGMGASGISVLGFWGDDLDPYPMIQTFDLVIADNIIENNYGRPPQIATRAEYIEVVAFGGIVLALADRLHIHDNRIQNNGNDFRSPVCGVYVLHGENINIESNLIRNNGVRSYGTAFSGNRAGIALQLVGRRLVDDFNDGIPVLPAARIRGNVVQQPAGRALQVYGIGPMFIEGNTLVSEGHSNHTRIAVPQCIDIHNIGQSPELLLQGVIPADIAYFPAPALLDPDPTPNPDLLDGRVLFTDNQVRFAPAVGFADNIFVANRFQSYGDVAILDNQFLTVFPEGGGSMVNDTIVVAWTTRTNNNRWEDPAREVPGTGVDTEYETDASAVTLAFYNYTTLNVASRCIHASRSSVAPSAGNPVADNLTYTPCDPEPMLLPLLEAP